MIMSFLGPMWLAILAVNTAKVDDINLDIFRNSQNWHLSQQQN